MTGLLMAAAAAGLLGSGHCVGMCGPLAAASAPGWHAGRLVAYLAAGALAGGLGVVLPGGAWAPVVAAIVLTWSCLRFGGFISENNGISAWVGHVARWTSGLGAVRGVTLGALVVVLPCGLLWTAFAFAAATRGAASGALVLAVHYAASMPAILVGGGLLRRASARARRPASLALLALGLLAIGVRASGMEQGGTFCLPP